MVICGGSVSEYQTLMKSSVDMYLLKLENFVESISDNKKKRKPNLAADKKIKTTSK